MKRGLRVIRSIFQDVKEYKNNVIAHHHYSFRSTADRSDGEHMWITIYSCK